MSTIILDVDYVSKIVGTYNYILYIYIYISSEILRFCSVTVLMFIGGFSKPLSIVIVANYLNSHTTVVIFLVH